MLQLGIPNSRKGEDFIKDVLQEYEEANDSSKSVWMDLILYVCISKISLIKAPGSDERAYEVGFCNVSCWRSVNRCILYNEAAVMNVAGLRQLFRLI